MPASWFPMTAPPPAVGTAPGLSRVCRDKHSADLTQPRLRPAARARGPRSPPRAGPAAAAAQARPPGPAPGARVPPQHSPAQAEPAPPAPEAAKGSEAGLGAAEPAPLGGRGRGGAVRSHPAPAGDTALCPGVRGRACAVAPVRLCSQPRGLLSPPPLAPFPGKVSFCSLLCNGRGWGGSVCDEFRPALSCFVCLLSHVKEELWGCRVSCEPGAEPAEAVRVRRCLQEMGAPVEPASGASVRTLSQQTEELPCFLLMLSAGCLLAFSGGFTYRSVLTMLGLSEI